MSDIDQKDIIELSATPSNPTFYFNIIVKDEAGNRAAYSAVKNLDFALTSSASDGGFDSGSAFGVEFKDNYAGQCTGQNNFPKLAWQNPPLGTQSFAIVVDDPSGGDWVHLNLFNISATVTNIPKTVGGGNVPDLSIYGTQGKNSWDGTGNSHSTGWAGPCPPSGSHTYYFKIYALSMASITINNAKNRSQFDTAFSGTIIAAAEISGFSN